MSRRFIKFSFPVILLVGIYFLGPSPQTPEWSTVRASVPTSSDSLEHYINTKEKRHKLKPDNEARIIWADSSRRKTEYAVVYLHGFSASQKEGDPIHRRFAKEFGCNLYLARLADHGIDTTEALLQFTSERWWISAKEALAIGNAIGDKVILISTSTGSTVALALAAEFPDEVHALINLSPNVELRNNASFLLNNPWGLYIARAVMKGKYRESNLPQERLPYWNHKYRVEALVQLEEMLESKMNESTFQKIRQPSLTLYYYKNEDEQDPEVSVEAMLLMHSQLATSDSLKKEVAIPSAGAHVIGSSLTSKDVEGVYNQVEKFALETLRLQKKF